MIASFWTISPHGVRARVVLVRLDKQTKRQRRGPRGKEPLCDDNWYSRENGFLLGA